MSYCGICGREHDMDVGCFDGAGQALRDAGMRRRAATGAMPVTTSSHRGRTRLAVALLLVTLAAGLVWGLAVIIGAR